MVIPFFVFGGKTFRHFAILTFTAMSIYIQTTGNFGIFNILTIVLSIPLLDPRNSLSYFWLPRVACDKFTSPLWHRIVTSLLGMAHICLGVLLFSRILIYGKEAYTFLSMDGWLFYPTADRYFTPALITSLRYVAPFRAVNAHGIFRQGAEVRSNMVIQVSDEGENWIEVPSKWIAPAIFAPHQPRLVHQLFYEGMRIRFGLFSGVNPYLATMPFFPRLLLLLARGSSSACSLMGGDFSVCSRASPERRVRVLSNDEVAFTTIEERARDGALFKNVGTPRLSLSGPLSEFQLRKLVECMAAWSHDHVKWILRVREAHRVHRDGRWSMDNVLNSTLIHANEDCDANRMFTWLRLDPQSFLGLKGYHLEHATNLDKVDMGLISKDLPGFLKAQGSFLFKVLHEEINEEDGSSNGGGGNYYKSDDDGEGEDGDEDADGGEDEDDDEDGGEDDGGDHDADQGGGLSASIDARYDELIPDDEL